MRPIYITLNIRMIGPQPTQHVEQIVYISSSSSNTPTPTTPLELQDVEIQADEEIQANQQLPISQNPQEYASIEV